MSQTPECEQFQRLTTRIPRQSMSQHPDQSSPSLPRVRLFTDGACRGNPGPGGWAFILLHPATQMEMEKSGGCAQTTNNQMELQAVIEGLATLQKRSTVEVVTDSRYVAQGCVEWMPNWKKNNWRRRVGRSWKPVRNEELWQRLDELLAGHEVQFTLVRGHSGHPENERCDELAVAAAEQYHRAASQPCPEQRNVEKTKSSCEITLALGGGGARGAAHLGVIEVLDDAAVRIERIVGVSIGSLVGAVYAVEPDIQRAQTRVLQYLLSPNFQRHQETLFGSQSDSGDDPAGGMFSWYGRVKGYLRANRIFHRVVTHPSMLPGLVLQDAVNHLLPDVDIADTRVPLSIVAVDLLTGHRIVLEQGPLRTAVQASSALPGIFPPVAYGDALLCDIGVLNSIPTMVARSYEPDHVVAVDVTSDLQPIRECDTALDVMMRVDEIGEALFRKHVRDAADLIIRPKVSGIEWFDFSSPHRLIDAGRDAARQTLPALAKWTESGRTERSPDSSV